MSTLPDRLRTAAAAAITAGDPRADLLRESARWIEQHELDTTAAAIRDDDHYLTRHYAPPVGGDRPEPWQLTFTCGGCGEELWAGEEGHGSTPGTPDDALQRHLRAEARTALAERLNGDGWTCHDGTHEPGEYARCSECTAVCDELAEFLLTHEYVTQEGTTR